MKLFHDHHGERIAIDFGIRRITGFIAGIESDCVKVSSEEEGKGNVQYVPWPNSNVLSIEFTESSPNRRVGF